jgi:alpha-galactosidase
MCHGFNGAYKVARAMGLDKEEVTFEIAGVNHFIWMTEFKYRGEDAYPILDKWIEEHSGLLVDHEEELKKFGLGGDEVNRKAVDIYHRFGLFPIGDTPSSGGGAWGWEYHTDDECEKYYKCKPYEWYGIMFKGNAGFTKELEHIVADKSVKVSDVFPPHVSPEPMIPLLEGLAFDTHTRVVVNVLNDGGYMKGLPTDYEVEIAANIDKDGVHPICNEGLPKAIMAHLLRDRVAPVEIELAAFENHSRELLVDLVMTDPWTKNRAQAEKLVQDILDLPINSRMKEYYR